MRLRLLYFDGCPSWRLAEQRLRQAVAAVSSPAETQSERAAVEIELVLVETMEDAERLRFRGSPTILFEDEDLFTPTDQLGFTCRLYRTESGLEGAPSSAQLTRAIRQRLTPG